MTLFLAALVILLLGGTGAVVAGRRTRVATSLGVGGAVLGGVLGLGFALGVLLRGTSPELMAGWSVPYGSFALRVDGLSALFLVLTFLVPAIAAVYGGAYLAPYGARRRLGPTWFFYNLLTVSMALVVVSANAMLFLVSWEVMSLASFFLVVFEDERLDVRRAGWTYLVATHLGTAFLLVFFILLDTQTVSTGVLFGLALVGFGTKAGLVPVHIWLPEAHPAAPSHVSAVMSGVMIKVGVYGILRALLLLGAPGAWWGPTLVLVGAATGLVGVLFALSQGDLKRLLAYSSVENVGLILMAAGLGVLGVTRQVPVLAVLGFGGALFHVLNHGLFKSLLFLCAGAVRHEAGTLELDVLGGLLRRMPWTGIAFLVGAAATSALPPLNGFASELLLYAAALEGVVALGPAGAWPALLAVVAVALIGGIALLAFVKAFATAFLGAPRGEGAAAAHEPERAMLLPLLLLAALCAIVGLLPMLAWPLVAPAATLLAGGAGAAGPALQVPAQVLVALATAGLVLVALALVLLLVRLRLLRGRELREDTTWACGFAGAVPRAQYTGSSLAEPVADFLEPLLPSRNLLVREPAGLFPTEAWVKTASADVFRRRFYTPLFGWVGGLSQRARALQHGHLQWYLLYIFATLVALLILEFGVRR